MSVTTIQAEASQGLFEFLHMEIVSQIQQDVGPDLQVHVAQITFLYFPNLPRTERGTTAVGVPRTSRGREFSGEGVPGHSAVQE